MPEGAKRDSLPKGLPKAGIWWLCALCVAHAVLAIGYAVETPYRSPGRLVHQRGMEIPDVGAPDERQHSNYVQHLADGSGFPVLRPGSPDLGETYQSHQPPLYYALALGWAKLLTVQSVAEPEAGTKLRSLNALVGAAGAAGAFYLGWWMLKRWEPAAIAAAIVALLPMNIALSGAVTNDALLIALCTWTLALAALGSQAGWTLARGATVGILLGLAILTKTTAIALVPAVLLALFWNARRERAWSAAAIAVGCALPLVAPWWIRNQQLYGDPLAMGVFADAFQGSPKAQMFVDAFGQTAYWTQWVGWWTLRSFFGAFGYMDIFLPNWMYAVLATLLGVTIVARSGFRDDPILADTLRLRIALGTFALAVCLLFVLFNRAYFQGQARYLLPAIGPISCAIALGIIRLASRRPVIGILSVCVLLGSLNVYILSMLPGEFERRSMGAPAASAPSEPSGFARR